MWVTSTPSMWPGPISCDSARASARLPLSSWAQSRWTGLGLGVSTGPNSSCSSLVWVADGSTCRKSSIMWSCVHLDCWDSFSSLSGLTFSKGYLSSQNFTFRLTKISYVSKSNTFHPFLPNGYPRKVHLSLLEVNYLLLLGCSGQNIRCQKLAFHYKKVCNGKESHMVTFLLATYLESCLLNMLLWGHIPPKTELVGLLIT